MGDYDPKFSFSRQMLALSIVNKLEDSGFVLIENKKPKQNKRRRMTWQEERVYERKLKKQDLLKVRVYTTVVGGEDQKPLTVRHSGKDAIRVCGTYTTRTGVERGIVSEKRVNRTGNIEEIIERMLDRMRQTWKALQTGEVCGQCGAPKFVSRAGNKVCAEICWQTDEEKRAAEIAYKTQRKRKGRKW